jgi:hypothetical protein
MFPLSNGTNAPVACNGGRPRVADVDDIRSGAGRGRGENAVEQVGPTDHLDVDRDAGLLLELVQLRLELLLVVGETGALIARPVRQCGPGAAVRRTAAAAATRGQCGGEEGTFGIVLKPN